MPNVTVTNRPPPDFSQIPSENAIKFTFSTTTGRWTETRVKVKIERDAFAKGGLRKAHHLQFEGESNPKVLLFIPYLSFTFFFLNMFLKIKKINHR